MTTITIRLWATFPGLADKFQKSRHFELQVDEGMTVVQLVGGLLGIGEEYISVIAVNGEVVDPETALHNRDHVDLFRPLAGG
jgi:sulfur carrier protein ThiS